ncbi:hypothetical protein GOBAR_AA28413 [Gossypium barbadense]|uniref:Uncharacterized protein n=1 Tax=Gossypium barbadense TaxID=3634 RepID=A0A2P5WMD1_GOSBA|nr:hypothetical protein GOBAR_AA28413 [Gossypium barbadense]
MKIRETRNVLIRASDPSPAPVPMYRGRFWGPKHRRSWRDLPLSGGLMAIAVTGSTVHDRVTPSQLTTARFSI